MCTATSLHSHYTHRLESMPSINKSLCDILENIRQSYSAFFLDNSCLFKVMGLLDIEMEQGLCQESKATVKMLNSFVRSIPNGSESGRFLALDLGGTNFRILLIQLGELYDENNCVIAVDSFELPKTLMIGEGYVLFDHIADCLSTFISKHDLSGFKLPLGFTFSFPMYQNKLNHGVLVTWTKGFKCSGVVGQDVVMLLQDAIVRQGTIDVEIVAILNDGVGALMSSAFVDCNAAVAVIIGTGSNAAYFEKIENVKKTHFAEKQPGRVIIDTEWAAFGENGVLDFLFTHFDTLLDKLTVHPGQYVFEKMISGMYLGELTRLVLMDLIDRKIIFDAKEPGELASENSFKTDYLSAVETDFCDGQSAFTKTRQIFENLGLKSIALDDCIIIGFICAMISQRAAYLAAAATATLVRRVGMDNVTIGFDGSMLRCHPSFSQMLQSKLRELVDCDIQFNCIFAEDGSGRGAALVAAVANNRARA